MHVASAFRFNMGWSSQSAEIRVTVGVDAAQACLHTRSTRTCADHEVDGSTQARPRGWRVCRRRNALASAITTRHEEATPDGWRWRWGCSCRVTIRWCGSDRRRCCTMRRLSPHERRGGQRRGRHALHAPRPLLALRRRQQPLRAPAAVQANVGVVGRRDVVKDEQPAVRAGQRAT